MKDYTRLIVFAFYIFCVFVSLYFANLKRVALGYDEIDYAFYAQFAARFAEPHLSDQYTVQPQGYNFVGYMGTDGKDTLHQSVHFELIKYGYVFLYALIPSLLFLSFFIALVYFLPVVYLGRIHPTQTAPERWFVFVFALLYTSIPSVFYMTTHDLRPRILMIPSFTLAMLAVHYRRPLLEKWFLFGALFFIREEALLFGPVVLVYNVLRASPGRERNLSTAGFGILWLVGLGIISGYFAWTGYPIAPAYSPVSLILSNRLLLRLLVGGGVCFFGVFFICWIQRRKFPWVQEVLQILVYTTIFIPLGIQFSTMLRDWLFADGPSTREVLTRFLFSPNTTFPLTAAVILFVFVRNALKSPKLLKIVQPVFFLFGLGLFGLQLVHLSHTLTDYVQRAKLAEIVTHLRAETDPYTTHILADYQTYQAFFDYEHVALYQRLPWQLAGADRYYPDNLPYLQQILNRGMDMIVINRENAQDIQDLLATINLRPIRIVENEQYQILQFE